MANNTEQVTPHKLFELATLMGRNRTEDFDTWVAYLEEWHEAEATRREQALKDELLFDLDEIDNKPWRVFRQLANIMPEYADTYTDYEAFYSYGGGNEVRKLIDSFKQTDDYKQSGFKEKSELLMAELKRQAEGGDDNV